MKEYLIDIFGSFYHVPLGTRTGKCLLTRTLPFTVRFAHFN